jgi:hypothetical protein
VVSGQNFSQGIDSCYINGSPLTTVWVNYSTILCTTIAGTAGSSVSIYVYRDSQTSSNKVSFTYLGNELEAIQI